MREFVRKALLVIFGLSFVAGIVGVVVVFVVSEGKLDERHSPGVVAVRVPTDPAEIERGGRLVRGVARCQECHGEDLGGAEMADAAVGYLAAPNITSGNGGLPDYGVVDWVRSIRHGVSRDGRGLWFQPAGVYARLSDRDLGAMIAWLQRVTPVNKVVRESSISFTGRISLTLGSLKLTQVEEAASIEPASVEPGETRDYGRYLAQVGGCTGCHGDDLRGGRGVLPPELPEPADIAALGSRGWTRDDLARALREGRGEAGSALNAFMPWRHMRALGELEIGALWALLQ